jgi:hypothetical protein
MSETFRETPAERCFGVIRLSRRCRSEDVADLFLHASASASGTLAKALFEYFVEVSHDQLSHDV